MIKRLAPLGAVFIILVLVSCSSDKDERSSGPGGSGGPPGNGRQQMMGPPEIPEDAVVYEGVFSMENGIFPALVEDDGTVWYLVMNFPFSEDMLPKEGKEILVKAVASEDHPERITIHYLEVEGEVVEPEMPDRPGGQGGPPGGGGSGGGRG